MIVSLPTRRRLLGWATGAVLLPDRGRTGILEDLPGFKRKDPRILTQTYRQADDIRLEGRAIAVTPFSAPQGGAPTPPDFAPFLGKALTWAYPDCTVHLDAEPCPCAEVIIRGRIDLYHRLGAAGLKVRVSATVLDVSAAEEYVLWFGAKKADWIRRFAADDCLLVLADDFVTSWRGDSR